MAETFVVTPTPLISNVLLQFHGNTPIKGEGGVVFIGIQLLMDHKKTD